MWQEIESKEVKKIGIHTAEAVVQQDTAGYFISRARVITNGIHKGTKWSEPGIRTKDQAVALQNAVKIAETLL